MELESVQTFYTNENSMNNKSIWREKNCLKNVWEKSCSHLPVVFRQSRSHKCCPWVLLTRLIYELREMIHQASSTGACVMSSCPFPEPTPVD